MVFPRVLKEMVAAMHANLSMRKALFINAV